MFNDIARISLYFGGTGAMDRRYQRHNEVSVWGSWTNRISSIVISRFPMYLRIIVQPCKLASVNLKFMTRPQFLFPCIRLQWKRLVTECSLIYFVSANRRSTNLEIRRARPGYLDIPPMHFLD
jgi:hypothetical protein